MLKINLSKIISMVLHWQFAFFLLIIIVCSVLEFSDLKTLLRYDRSLIESGQWFRLITANFVHLNTPHLLLNMSSVCLVMLFFSRHISLSQWVMLILMSCLFVSVGLYVLNPAVKTYVGLSGVLHGLFIVGAVKEIKHFPVSGWLLLAAFVVKLSWEQLVGAVPGSAAMVNGVVLVESHLYGAISGGVFLVLQSLFNGKKK